MEGFDETKRKVPNDYYFTPYNCLLHKYLYVHELHADNEAPRF